MAEIIDAIIGFLSPKGEFIKCHSWGHGELAKVLCKKLGYDDPYLNAIDAERNLLDKGYIIFRRNDAYTNHFVSKENGGNAGDKILVNLLTDAQLAFIERHNKSADWNNEQQAECIESILDYHNGIKETLETEGDSCNLVLNTGAK